MPAKMSQAELFLSDFHHVCAGLTSQAFSEMLITFRGRKLHSSYEKHQFNIIK